MQFDCLFLNKLSHSIFSETRRKNIWNKGIFIIVCLLKINLSMFLVFRYCIAVYYVAGCSVA